MTELDRMLKIQYVLSKASKIKLTDSPIQMIDIVNELKELGVDEEKCKSAVEFMNIALLAEYEIDKMLKNK